MKTTVIIAKETKKKCENIVDDINKNNSTNMNESMVVQHLVNKGIKDLPSG